MDMEAERNVCPDCGKLVPVGEGACPHCGRRFLPQRRSWWGYYAQAWRLCLTFSGRAPLAELLAHAIPYALLLLWACFYCLNALKINPFLWNEAARLPRVLPQHPGLAFLLLYLLVALVPLPALFVRRLHDVDVGLGDAEDEGAVSEGNFQDGSPGWWVLWRYDLLGSGPLGWILSFFPRLRHTLMGIVTFPVRVWEDSIPGPNRFGPGTRYPRFLDRR